MGEFQDAVSTLLDAFARGLAVIKRKKQQLPGGPAGKAEDKRLSKSLKKSKIDVRNAYERDIARFGPDFAVGDAEAHSSLSAILFRLNAGFVSVIERFTRGRSTSTDYAALVNLSNASRREAILTFEQLSMRLSRSSLALVPIDKDPRKHSRPYHGRHGSSSSTLKQKSRSKKGLSVSPTGWVRPKAGRKRSSDSKASLSSKSSAPRSPPPNSQQPAQIEPPRSFLTTSHQPSRIESPKLTSNPPQQPARIRSPLKQRPTPHRSKLDDRKSIMSFASNSTKLGEIPEHKWTTPPVFEGGEVIFPVRAYFPLDSYQAPEKPRSRFMKFFRR